MKILKAMKSDAYAKTYTKRTKCIFWGRYWLRVDKVDPYESVKEYSNSPLRVLQGKMTMTLQQQIEDNMSSDKKFPNSFQSISKCAPQGYSGFR